MQSALIFRIFVSAVIAQIAAGAGLVLMRQGWVEIGRAIVIVAITVNILLVMWGAKIAFDQIRNRMRGGKGDSSQ